MKRQAALGFIFVTILVDVLAFGITIPILPKLIEELSGGNTAQAARIYGAFGTVWALMQFICAPILGVLSDRFGRRPVLLLSLLGLGLDYGLMALAPTLGWLFAGRILSGMLAANYATAGAYIADVTPPERRAAGYGIMGAAWGLGFVLGPALGGILGQISPRLPFWAAGALTLLNVGYGLLVLPESLPRERRRPSSLRNASPIGSLALLRGRPGLLELGVVYLLHHVAHHVLPSVFVLWAGYRLGWDTRMMGIALAVVGVASVVVQGTLVRPIVARIGERKSLVAGLVAELAAYAIYGVADRAALIWVGVVVGAFAGLFNPALQGLMSRRVEATDQGRLQGANGSLMGIAGLIGPGLFTLTFAQFISGPVILPGAPFLLAAVIVAAALVIALRSTADDHGAAPLPAPPA